MKHKYLKIDNMYYHITEDLGDRWKCFTAGGGFEGTILKSKGTVVDSIPNQMIDCFAVIDDFMGPYKCKANPLLRWNGWARPMFDLQTLNKILRDCEDMTVLKRYETEIVVKTSNDDEPWSIHRDNNGLWEIDGWCWDIQDSKGRYISRDGSVSQSNDDDEE